MGNVRVCKGRGKDMKPFWSLGKMAYPWGLGWIFLLNDCFLAERLSESETFTEAFVIILVGNHHRPVYTNRSQQKRRPPGRPQTGLFTPPPSSLLHSVMNFT